MAGALIVLVEFGKADFAMLDALRRRNYPSERNHVPAHLTLFRALPPSAEEEVLRSLARAASASAPRARIAGVLDLDAGVALRVESPELEELRSDLAAEFHRLLTAQDEGRWTPHVTIQNKVEPRVARALLREMKACFEPRPVAIAGLQLVRYLDPRWQPLSSWRFR